MSICAHVFIVQGNGTFTWLLPLLTRNGSPEFGICKQIIHANGSQWQSKGANEAPNYFKCKTMALSPAAWMSMGKDTSALFCYGKPYIQLISK